MKVSLIEVGLLIEYSSHIFRKDSANFRFWKITLKLRSWRSLTRLFTILWSLTRSLFSEKMLISNRYSSGLMPNLIKKSWTVSTQRSMTAMQPTQINKFPNFQNHTPQQQIVGTVKNMKPVRQLQVIYFSLLLYKIYIFCT